MSCTKDMGRVIIDQGTRVIGWLNKDRRRALHLPPPVKVNLGCGLQVAPGWVNIDGSPNALIAQAPTWVHSFAYRLSGAKDFYSRDYYQSTLRDNNFIYHNLAYGIPLLDNAVDFLYTSHFLEHLDRSVGRRLLSECYRVLRDGGIVRVAVPDLEIAWNMYVRGEKERMIHDFFFAEEVSGFGRHRYAYDFELLRETLQTVGFINVRKMRHREGSTPDLEHLDNREDYTLFVEASKDK